MSTMINFNGISDLQVAIMHLIDDWAHKNSYPIPLKEIKTRMVNDDIKNYTVVNALTLLIKKGYIRRAVTMSNTTSYVQLRRV
jgi:hypothetical protein